jgi:hypothetical protein
MNPSWMEHIFRYCERGQDPSFWAEPLNAVSNAAFLIAAVVAGVELARRPDASRRLAEWALVALVFIIGVGSFMFHTFATRWAAIADTGPIGLFMLAYLCFALRRYLNLPWLAVLLGLGVFVWSLNAAGDISCPPGLGITDAARGPCLNGTVGYVPAGIAMLGIGAVLLVLGHPAWRLLLAAGGVFVVSMFFRTVDWELCEATRAFGRLNGTHFLWHLLNAATLYLLLRAAIASPSAAAARQAA